MVWEWFLCWGAAICHIVKMHYYSENLLYSGTWFRQTKCIFMMTEEGSNKIINFMTPGEVVLVLRCGHLSYIVKSNDFFKNLLPYSRAQIRQTVGIVIMLKEGFTKTKFIYPQSRGSCTRAWPYKSYSENTFFLLEFLFFTRA